MKRFLILAVLVAACGGCQFPNQKFVEEEAATYQAVAPFFLKYVDADATKSDEAKKAAHDTVLLWRKNLDAQGAK